MAPTAPPASIDLSREACELRLFTSLYDITVHPQRWDQHSWACTHAASEEFEEALDAGEWPCKTSGCLAGHACIWARLCHIDVLDDGWLELTKEGVALVNAFHTELELDHTMDPDQDFPALGAVLFGLDAEQGYQLFEGHNSLQRMWQLAAGYTQGRVHLPAELVEQVDLIDEARGNY